MDFQRMVAVGNAGILAMTTDALGSDRPGHTPTEDGLTGKFEEALKDCKGRFLVTTYSSNVARLNQVIEAAEKMKRKVCFVGRSLIKVSELAYRMGYLKMEDTTAIEIDQLKNFPAPDFQQRVRQLFHQDNFSTDLSQWQSCLPS